MITLITKYWKVILDAILIVALIVLVFIWNPFNLFGKGINLKPTTNMVMEVREIGQLVTAQYYGEVVASLGEARLNLLQEDNLTERGDYFYRKLKQDIFSSYKNLVITPVEQAKKKNQKNRAQRKGRKKALDEIASDYGKEYSSGDHQTFITDTLDIILLCIVETQISEPVSENLTKFKKEKKRDKFRAKRLENLYDEIAHKHAVLNEDDFKEYLEQGFDINTSFSSFYYNITEEEIKNKEQLAMIGRGSVKAGFDFTELSDRNIRFDENKNILHIFGVKPTILNYDINPWFIPQQAVPGFDIVQAGRKANFLDAVKVKSYCRNKLKASALEAGILEEAQRYGSEVMKSFFSLVMDKEILQVRFHDDLEEVYYQQIASDSIIDYSEIPFIQTIEQEYLLKIDTTKKEILKSVYQQQFQDLLYKLRKLNIRMKDSTETPFSYFSYSLFHIISDSTLTEKSYAKITSAIRWKINSTTFSPLGLDSIKAWYINPFGAVNPYQFTKDYNKLLSFLANRNQYIHGADTLPFEADEFLYPINPTVFFVDSISKVDTLNLESIRFQNAKLSPLQENDVKIYKAYLEHQHTAYVEKSWVYKWRDKVSTKVDLGKLQEDLREKVGFD